MGITNLNLNLALVKLSKLFLKYKQYGISVYEKVIKQAEALITVKFLEKETHGSQDKGQIKPYKYIYWAHAWTPDKKAQLDFILTGVLRYAVSF